MVGDLEVSKAYRLGSLFRVFLVKVFESAFGTDPWSIVIGFHYGHRGKGKAVRPLHPTLSMSAHGFICWFGAEPRSRYPLRTGTRLLGPLILRSFLHTRLWDVISAPNSRHRCTTSASLRTNKLNMEHAGPASSEAPYSEHNTCF